MKRLSASRATCALRDAIHPRPVEICEATKHMDISLVICTRNRASQLSEALRRLERIETAIPWELVIVDNGSTDSTRSVLREFQSRGGLHARAIVTFEGLPGLGRARNTGWRTASGRIIAFSDDDCYPQEDYISRMMECFAEREIGFIGGRVLLFDSTDIRLTIQELGERVELLPRTFIRAGLIQGANFAVRREVLEAVGGFDDRFGAGTPFACEDVDLLARASALGWKGAYDPRPVVYHHHGRKSWRFEGRRLLKVYDVARGAYYTKTILNRPMSRVYLLRWLELMTKQSPFRTLRELKGGLRFLVAEFASHQETGVPRS